MYIKKVFPISGMIIWTRKYILLFLLISFIPVFLFDVLEWTWLHLPWLPIGLLGTAVAFIQGFKNNASYDRLWEARKIWGGIVNTSRTWTIMVKDFITNDNSSEKLSADELKIEKKKMVMRHVAWMTALRYQLRQPKPWEVDIHSKKNKKFRERNFALLESDIPKEEAISPYLSEEELSALESKGNWASQILGLQSSHLKELKKQGHIEDFRHMELMNVLKELYTLQGKSERIKNCPYPRQFATLNLYFIWIFIFLLPFGVMDAFQDIGQGFITEMMEHEHQAGFFHMLFDALGKHFVWLSIPFSALISWVFYTLEMIGENTENPFEGGVNDVPITNMTRGIEIDIRQLIDDVDIPAPYEWKNGVVL
ncbi:MAG: bestrophin family ion channel [Saprospiraceae bacterium]|nr:bestrophin family ion channel [Saprospiraceae bacterium]